MIRKDENILLSAVKSLLRPLVFVHSRLSAGLHGRSYAQDGEDKILVDLLGQVRFFVDIGANDGRGNSNTFYFALRGAAGVCFEPIGKAFRQLKLLYSLNPRVTCRRCAISDREGTVAMMRAGQDSQLSFLPETADSDHQQIHAQHGSTVRLESVQLKPFREAIKGCSIPPVVDLLSIDVEGHELNVLRSIPFEEYAFRAIVVETHIRDQWVHRDINEITSLLATRGYFEKCKTDFNTIYVRGDPLISSTIHSGPADDKNP